MITCLHGYSYKLGELQLTTMSAACLLLSLVSTVHVTHYDLIL